MDVVKYVQDNLDVRAILDYYGFRDITETASAYRACCMIHGGNNPTAFIWNKENNLWFCHTGDCGGGDVFNLIERIDKINFSDAVKKAACILGLDITGMSFDISIDRLNKEQRKWLERQRKRLGNKQNAEYAIPYVNYYTECETFDRFPSSVLEHFDARFCKIYPLEESVLKNKLVIPLTEEGKTVGVALRDTTGKYLPKWMYAPKQIKIDNILYNYETVVELTNKGEIDEVILVEGIFDVWAYYQIGIKNVVAVFGSSVSDEQFSAILKLGIDVVLSLKNKTTINFINFALGKDPADLTAEELMTAYMNRNIYTE